MAQPHTKKKIDIKPWFKQHIWTVLSLLIAVITIRAVAAQTQGTSLESFLNSISRANWFWLGAALCAMLGFIHFEACAVRCICQTLSHPTTKRKSWMYAAADIYFSAITPSATGGQPACALLMVQDGIPVTGVTATLLLNVTMYTLCIPIVGVICVLLRPGMFFRFSGISQVLIVAGALVQVGLTFFFYLLVKNERLLHKLCSGLLWLLGKLHLVRQEKKLETKLIKLMEDYRQCSTLLVGQRKMLLRVFLYNLLQRTSQILVTVFVCLAMGGDIASPLDIWAMQSYVVLGSNFVPIPGGMGVTDYLMLDGLGFFTTAQQAADLEILSRSLSFYGCVLLCCAVLLIRFACYNREKRRTIQNDRNL